MDMYGSDIRLSDIGRDGDDQLDEKIEYPLDMLDRLSGDSSTNHHCTDSSEHGQAGLVDFNLPNPLDSDHNNWLDTFLGDTVFQDSLISDDDPFQPQHVKSEHSYSMSNGTDNNPLDFPLDLSFEVKLETEKDMETEELFETVDPALTILTDTDVTTDDRTHDDAVTLVDVKTSLLKNRHYQPTLNISRTVQFNSVATTSNEDVVVVHDTTGSPHLGYIKTEPQDSDDRFDSFTCTTVDFDPYSTLSINLPPTPPGSSSSSSSDSEAGGLTPTRSNPSSPVNSPYQRHVQHNQGGLYTATLQQPTCTFPTTNGSLYLTEEEKRTLVAEGYSVPNKLPLTKQEEKNLKKIRRKIKNKISAQESRRKKKEYVDTLEKKMEVVVQENSLLRKKVDVLETNNRSLMSQMQRLQGLVNKMSQLSQPCAQVT